MVNRPTNRGPARTTRPNFNAAAVNRSGISRFEGNRANINRPGMNRQPSISRFDANRTNFNRSNFNRPNTITRGGFNNPAFNINNRQNFVNRNQFQAQNRLNLNQRFTSNTFNTNRWNAFRQGGNWNGGPFWGGGRRWDRDDFWGAGFWNRPWFGGWPWWYWNRPWGWWNAGWYRGAWDWPWLLPSFWLGNAPYGSWFDWQPDTFVYNNPYYVVPSNTAVVPGLDYSQPIPAPSNDEADVAYPPAPAEETTTDGTAVPEESATTETAAASPPAPEESNDPAVREAYRQFDAAREAFRRGDYTAAQEMVEKAIEQLPSDAVLHEFRALTLFAQGRYSDAAAALYAVLAAGPGWDWDTMIGSYPDRETYTQQLRALEDHLRNNPNDSAGRFVLTYHYLVLGYKDEAVNQLREVVRLKPDDKLSAELLRALTSANNGSAISPRPAPAAKGPGPRNPVP
jgi:tetratricopeptide (TPR) repeat protein